MSVINELLDSEFTSEGINTIYNANKDCIISVVGDVTITNSGGQLNVHAEFLINDYMIFNVSRYNESGNTIKNVSINNMCLKKGDRIIIKTTGNYNNFNRCMYKLIINGIELE